MKPHQNPAEFILEVTGAGIPKSEDPRQNRPQAAAEKQEGEEMKDVELGTKDENYYVETYKHSQFFADTQKQLEAGIFSTVHSSSLVLSIFFLLVCN